MLSALLSFVGGGMTYFQDGSGSNHNKDIRDDCFMIYIWFIVIRIFTFAPLCVYIYIYRYICSRVCF